MPSPSNRIMAVLLLALTATLFAGPILLMAQPEEEEEEPIQARPNPMDKVTRTPRFQSRRNFGLQVSIPGFGTFKGRTALLLKQGKTLTLQVGNPAALAKFGLGARKGERMKVSVRANRFTIRKLGANARGIILRQTPNRGFLLQKAFVLNSKASSKLDPNTKSGIVIIEKNQKLAPQNLGPNFAR